MRGIAIIGLSFVVVILLLCVQSALSAEPQSAAPLTQVHADFSTDPGWENLHNRIVAKDPPPVKQDFGWIAPSADHPFGASGAIGGQICDSTTPAWYAAAIGHPLTFNDHFSASGKVIFPPGQKNGDVYVGFFNHALQGWRPWSSVAIRFWAREHGIDVGVDYMTGKWGADGFETNVTLPSDGSVHTWNLSYDPDATAPQKWPDQKLHDYLSAKDRQTAEQVYEKAKKVEPEVTLEQIKQRLSTALAEGLVSYFHRGNQRFWTRDDDAKNGKGAITLQVDGGQKYTAFLRPEHHDEPVALDRFGVFNLQMYHHATQFYLSDLTVNGIRIDLSQDPHWQGHGNRVEFRETDFQRENFGYSQTNWAGKQLGEIGGTFYRVEAVDPLHGYYADDVGKLTLNDPISFSGNVCFVSGGTDAGMFIGFFNAKAQHLVTDDPWGAAPLDGMLGINIDGPTRIGYYFSPLCSPTQATASHEDGPIFLPTAKPHHFSFAYDPNANNGIGRITVTLDGKPFTLDLTPDQRRAGASFDHFGLVSVRRGGKCVQLYFDDLSYTARRTPGVTPIHHPQQLTVVPYPHGGRKY